MPGAVRTMSPRGIFASLVAIALALCLLSAGTHVWGQAALFSVNCEGSLPSWYGAWLHGATALVLGALARGQRPFRVQWAGLALVFAYLAVDELARLHDRLGAAVPFTAQLGSAWLYAWMVPYLALFGGLAIAYAGFMFRLPAPTRRGFVAAAVLFLGGAVGLEMASAAEAVRAGGLSVTYGWLSHLEELLELTGSAAFLSALIGHGRAQRPATPAPDRRVRPQPAQRIA